MIHGRSALVLHYSWVDDGNRIEADISLEGRHGIVRQTTVEAGRSVGLPNDWVEDVLPAGHLEQVVYSQGLWLRSGT